jgi:hypothetical protein
MVKSLVRDGVLVVFALVVGWWAHGGRPVQAAAEDYSYQFMSNNVNNALTVYDPHTRTVYVYQGVSSLGGSHVNCSYMFHMTYAGQPIERENCKVGTGLP